MSQLEYYSINYQDQFRQAKLFKKGECTWPKQITRPNQNVVLAKKMNAKAFSIRTISKLFSNSFVYLYSIYCICKCLFLVYSAVRMNLI
jgi:hypothetical protein